MGERPTRFRSFLRELKRRRVVQAATVYAGVGFVVLQAADIIFPMLLLPAWLSRAVLALVLLGFPIALVLAWAFQMTPEGLERVEEGTADAAGRERAGAPAATPAREGAWLSLPSALTVGALVLVGVGLGWFIGGGSSPGDAGARPGVELRGREGGDAPRAPLMHVSVTLPPGDSLVPGPGPSVAIAPDGSRLVYAARRNDATRLYLRSLDQVEAQPIRGTEGASAPFFSPDGEWLGFYADRGIRKVPVAGGPAAEVSEFGVRGASWGEGDTLIVAHSGTGNQGLWRVPPAGGEREQLTSTAGFDLEQPEQGHYWPQVLPGGRGVLYTSWNLPGSMRVAVVDLRSGEKRVLIEPGGQARYVPTGHLVYAWDGSLLAAPFDLEELRVTGPSVPVVEDIAMDSRAAAHFAVSRSGTLVRVPGDVPEGGQRLVWAYLDGRVEELPFGRASYVGVRTSPDGSRIVADHAEDRVRVWLFDPARATAQRLTEEKATEFWPIWSPDGESVVHNSNRYGGHALNLYRRVVDGSRPPERLTRSDYNQQPQSWTPDGSTLIYTEGHPQTGWDILALDVDGEREPRPVVKTPDRELHPSLSPDGRWLAYVSDRSGRYEVYLQRYPGPGGTIQVSPTGGVEPLWGPDGNRLYYRDVSGDTIRGVAFEGTAEPRLGTPEVLITGQYLSYFAAGRRYDLGPGGQRFLLIQERDDSEDRWFEPTRIDITLNWFGELQRLVERRGQ